MLVLTRRPNESIIIYDNIVITVLSIEGDKVKIGIAAPKEVPILRQELHQALLAQNQLETRLAAGPEPDTFKALRDLLISEAKPDEPPPPGANPASNPGNSAKK